MLVLEGLETADRPAAIGYFLLSFLMDLHNDSGRLVPILAQFGQVDSRELAAKKTHVESYDLKGAEFGEVFRVRRAVESGDDAIFGS